MLDDGWFGGRRDDTTSLGDWVESTDVWPDGLGPLVERVRALGMQFGLWVEPEMINLDSDLYRAHPDWLLADPRRLPGPSRHQYVLDVARPEVSEYLFDHLDRLVKRYRIDFLKWDHNRDPIVPGARRAARSARPDPGRVRAARPAARSQSRAGDRELRQRRRQGRPRHPGAHRPGVGERLQRRARTAVDPTGHPTAAAARADGLPRRTADLAHHLAHPRPVVPGRDRAVRALRDRVGHRVGHRRGPRRSGRGDRAVSAPAAVAALRGPGDRRPSGPGGPGARRGGRRRAPTRCSATSSAP